MPTRRVPLAALFMVLFGVLATLVVQAPAADASSVILCNGFSACDARNMGNHGYEKVYRQMWWRMYAGHNCTNYMSYRMINNGMPTARPWNSSGDARYWGVVFASKVTQTPKVGSVAWWSSNHVAYVEKIIDADTIVISEDHYGGDFDWRRIVRTGGGWPTGFIHLSDERIAAVTKPSVVGKPQVDQVLAANRGTWTQNGATYDFQWYAKGAPIVGATSQTFAPTPDLLGVPVQVRVRARKAGYLTGATLSPLTAVTAPGILTSTLTPTISGIAKVAATLTASPATFTPDPTAVSYTWLANGVEIPGATNPTLVLGAAQLDKVITVRSTATRAGYTTASSTSTATSPVGPEKIVIGHEPELSGPLFVGSTLSVGGASMTPGNVNTSYTWMRDGVVVPGRTDATYPLGAADVRSRISVLVGYTKPGYTTVTRTLTAHRTIRARSRLSVISRAHRQITVVVNGLGVQPVMGTVVVTTPSGARRTLTLVHGKATFTAPWIYSGLRTFTIEYLGSYAVGGGKVTRQVTVR